VEEGKQKNKPPLFLVETNSPSPSGEENKKLLHLLPCGSNRVLVPAAVAISLFLSLCVFHIIAEAFVVVLRSLFLSGEEARVAHVVLYTYGYIDRWIDAREDR